MKASIHSGERRILVDDDDLSLAAIVRSHLAARGIDVDSARSAREALALISHTDYPYELALIDLWIPPDPRAKTAQPYLGVQLAEQIAQISPSTKLIATSLYADAETTLRNSGRFAVFVDKNLLSKNAAQIVGELLGFRERNDGHAPALQKEAVLPPYPCGDPAPTEVAMKASKLVFKDRRGNLLASAIAGGIIMFFLAVVVFLPGEISTGKRGILRFFIATDAALLANFFVGGIVLQGRLGAGRIAAGGGFVLFVLIQFVFDPLETKTIVADTVPSIVPRDQQVEEAQEQLRELGLFDGATSGRLTSGTRDAIKRFQESEGLQADGILGPVTLASIRQAEEAI